MHLKLAYGREELRVEFPEGASVSVAQALGSVADRQSGVYESWCDKEGQLRLSLAVFVNGEHIRYREGFETELSDGDQVYVIPLIAGG